MNFEEVSLSRLFPGFARLGERDFCPCCANPGLKKGFTGRTNIKGLSEPLLHYKAHVGFKIYQQGVSEIASPKCLSQ